MKLKKLLKRIEADLQEVKELTKPVFKSDMVRVQLWDFNAFELIIALWDSDKNVYFASETSGISIEKLCNLINKHQLLFRKFSLPKKENILLKKFSDEYV